MTVAMEISQYQLDLVGVQEKSEGTGVAPNQHANIHFSVGRGIRIVN
jgi:hypothetical protein